MTDNATLEAGYGTVESSTVTAPGSQRSRHSSGLSKKQKFGIGAALANLLLVATPTEFFIEVDCPGGCENTVDPPGNHITERETSGQCSIECPDCIWKDGRADSFLDWLTQHERGGQPYCESIGGGKCIKRMRVLSSVGLTLHCEWSHDGDAKQESNVTLPLLHEITVPKRPCILPTSTSKVTIVRFA